MKLTTGGIAHTSIRFPVVGKITREPLPECERHNRIFLTNEIPSQINQMAGYCGVLTPTRVESTKFPVPLIFALQEADHLRTGDIVGMQPKSGFVRTLYRPDSDHNVIFATDRCNSNCLMCSQPPKDHDDIRAMTDRNLKLIEIIDSAPRRLVITGGEPTLLGENLFTIIAALRDKFPSTSLHMLTNGRIFAWPKFTARLAERGIQISCWESHCIRTTQEFMTM